ncbi:hypothetical protein DL98DRAFT_589231 [Cadophora sp. DSE1049]|nr:hypothetical protein DL98DRAFT_589231 [Cadophora sp. DSE1049]
MSDRSRLAAESGQETDPQDATQVTSQGETPPLRTATEAVLQDYSREQQKDHIRAILGTWNQEEIALFYETEFRSGPNGVDIVENVADELISSHARIQRRAKIDKSIAPFLPFNHNATALSLSQVDAHIRKMSPNLSPDDMYDIYTLQLFINPPFLLLSIITNLQKRQANLNKTDMKLREGVSGKIVRSSVYSKSMASEKNTIWKTVGRWSASTNVLHQIRDLAPKHRNVPVVEQPGDPVPGNKHEAYLMFVAMDVGISITDVLQRKKNKDKEIEDLVRKYQDIKALGKKIDKFSSMFRRSAGMMLWPFEVSKAMGKRASLDAFTNDKVEALSGILRLKPDFEQCCELSKECEAWLEPFLQRGMPPSTILARLEDFRLKHGIVFLGCHQNFPRGLSHSVELNVEQTQEDPIVQHLLSLADTDYISVRRGAWERQLSVRNTITELARNREISEELVLAILNIAGVPDNVQIGVPSEYGRFYGSQEAHDLQRDIDPQATMFICPVHIEHSSHWVGVVAVVPQREFIKSVDFYFLDSATGISDAEEATQVVRNWIRQRHPRAYNRVGYLPALDLTAPATILPIGQQNTGGNDCGVLVCANLLSMARNMTPLGDLDPSLGNRLREEYTHMLLRAAADPQRDDQTLFLSPRSNTRADTLHGIPNGTTMPSNNVERRPGTESNIASTSKHPNTSSTGESSKRQRTSSGYHRVTATSSRSSIATSTTSTALQPPSAVAAQPMNQPTTISGPKIIINLRWHPRSDERRSTAALAEKSQDTTRGP